jgi:dephospho-CoA kinase
MADAASRFAVGLTGGIGSGKSTVADMFAARGATVIDTDVIAHQLTAPDGAAIPEIRHIFGDGFIAASGAMDRDRMRAHVFADPHARHALESILHPLIRHEAEQAVLQAQGYYPLIVVPLLVESGTWKNRVSRVLVVDSPENLQIARVMQRSGLSEQQVRAIMASQASRTDRLAAADDVIVNDAQVTSLASRVDELHAFYCTLAARTEQ